MSKFSVSRVWGGKDAANTPGPKWAFFALDYFLVTAVSNSLFVLILILILNLWMKDCRDLSTLSSFWVYFYYYLLYLDRFCQQISRDSSQFTNQRGNQVVKWGSSDFFVGGWRSVLEPVGNWFILVREKSSSPIEVSLLQALIYSFVGVLTLTQASPRTWLI